MCSNNSSFSKAETEIILVVCAPADFQQVLSLAFLQLEKSKTSNPKLSNFFNSACNLKYNLFLIPCNLLWQNVILK